MLCRPYGAYVSGLPLSRGFTPPPMLCRPKGLMPLQSKPSFNLQQIAGQARNECLSPPFRGGLGRGFPLSGEEGRGLLPRGELEGAPTDRI